MPEMPHRPPNGNAWLQPHRLLLATTDDALATQLKQALCTLPVRIERVRATDAIPARIAHHPVHIVVVDHAAPDTDAAAVAHALRDTEWPGAVIAAIDTAAVRSTDALLAAGCFACVERTASRNEWKAMLNLLEQRALDAAVRNDPALRKMMEAALELLPTLAERLETAAHEQLFDEVEQTLTAIRNASQIDELQPITELIDRARQLLNPVGAHDALDEMIVEIVELCRGAAMREAG